MTYLLSLRGHPRYGNKSNHAAAQEIRPRRHGGAEKKGRFKSTGASLPHAYAQESFSRFPPSCCFLRALYVVFKGSWDMEKHRRSSPFLFGSFSFVDGGGIVDNFCRFCLSRGLVRGWNRRRRCFVPWDFVKPDTEIRPASCSGGPP
jgi:hypothetical protein